MRETFILKPCIHHVLLLENNSYEEIEKTISLLENVLTKICQRDKIQQIAQWCYEYHFKYTSKEEKTVMAFFEKYTSFSTEKLLPHIKNSYIQPIDIQINEFLMVLYYSGISSNLNFEPLLYFKPGKKGTLFYIRLPNERVGERFYIESTQFKGLHAVNFINGRLADYADNTCDPEPYRDLLDAIKEKGIKPPVSWLYQKKIDIYDVYYMRKDFFEILKYLPCDHQRLEDLYRLKRSRELQAERAEEIQEIKNNLSSDISDILGVIREIEREIDKDILSNTHVEKMKECLGDLEPYESVVSTIYHEPVRLI